ncbi:MAG: hypothetical protein KBE09_04130 [Candidatus Pacebacteria bacterium]|nr:hypothetical protein [Candidatus Paceibacterota bacterium]
MARINVIEYARVAARANSTEDNTLLMCSRLSHPTIREQAIAMLMKAEVHLEGADMSEFIERADDTSELVPITYKAKSRKEVEAAFDLRLAEIQLSTPIEFSDMSPRLAKGREVIPLYFTQNGIRPSNREFNAIEAHEKGHHVRQYSMLSDFFASAFDTSQVRHDPEDVAFVRARNPKSTEEQVKEALTWYYMTPSEVVERMSQLKNYFGMRGAEMFTAAHLAYARAHYISDTGIDNDMTEFFQMVTPATESDFLYFMNSSGV